MDRDERDVSGETERSVPTKDVNLRDSALVTDLEVTCDILHIGFDVLALVSMSWLWFNRSWHSPYLRKRSHHHCSNDDGKLQ